MQIVALVLCILNHESMTERDVEPKHLYTKANIHGNGYCRLIRMRDLSPNEDNSIIVLVKSPSLLLG